jgi:hypothetical protein
MMLLAPTNLEEKLSLVQKKSSVNILDEVKEILYEDHLKEQRIVSSLKRGSNQLQNNFKFDELETENIYHINSIKKICVDYRLRFLDTKYFKNKFPQEAISKTKALEKTHNTTLSGFKIIAPSKLFKLENADDPLLFAPIGNGYYYLIHKWGNDLHPLRKLLMMPFKSLENLMLFALVISFMITYVFNFGVLAETTGHTQFLILFLFMFKSVVGITIFYAFSRGKNVSNAIWNSKYYNA